MSDIEIIKAIINKRATNGIKFPAISGKKSVILEEKCKNTGTPYKITLRGIPDNFFIFKPDLDKMQTVFECSNGECCCADYVIIADDGAKKRVIYIELKASNNYDKKHVSNQLKGAECFIAYCKAIGNVFWKGGGGDFLRGYDARYVLIDRLVKFEKRPQQKKIASHTPERPIVFSYCNDLRYNQLAS